MLWPEVAQCIETVGQRLEIDPFGIDTRDLGKKLPLPINRQLTASNVDPSAFDFEEEEPVSAVLDDPTIALHRAIEDGSTQIVAITSHAVRLYELAEEAGIQTRYQPAVPLSFGGRGPR